MLKFIVLAAQSSFSDKCRELTDMEHTKIDIQKINNRSATSLDKKTILKIVEWDLKQGSKLGVQIVPKMC